MRAETVLSKIYREVELPLVPVLAEMELRGVALDVPYFSWLEKSMGAALLEDLAVVSRLAGREVNPRSAKQLSALLYDELEEPVYRYTKGGAPSTDKYALARLGTGLAEAVLAYRETATALTSFVSKLPKLVLDDGRIHGSFNQAGTWEYGDDYRSSPASGRLSSSGPNLQQISIRGRYGVAIRRGFIPGPGMTFVGGDVEQEELRIAAVLANEKELLRLFALGEDPHGYTARRLGVTRDIGKIGNYAFIYGVAAPKILSLAPELGSIEAAAEARQDFFKLYPAILPWHTKTVAKCRQLGYVETLLGRRRYLPAIWSRSIKHRREAERQAINHTVQGTGADILKLALRRVYDGLVQGDGIVLTSHDDVVVETTEPSRVRPIISSMTDGLFPILLPVELKRGPNWGDMIK